MEDFNFSAEPTVFGPFAIFDKKYILKEATEDAHIAYRNVTTKALKFIPGESASGYYDGGNEADAILLQRCLFEIPSEGKELPTKLDFVRGLPRRISKKLYAKAREISGMDEDEEDILFLEKRIERDTKKLESLKKGEDNDAKKG